MRVDLSEVNLSPRAISGGATGGGIAVGVAAFGAARLLRALLAIAAVPVVAVDRGDLISPNLLVALAVVSLTSVAVGVFGPDKPPRSLATVQVALDVVLALAVSSLADAQAMPLVWLALLVPAMTAGEHFGLSTAVATWTAVSFGFAGLSFGFGPNDYTNSEVLRLVIQQVVASVAIVGSVVYVARRNWASFEQVASDGQVARQRLQHLLAIGDTAMRLAEADDPETVSRETIAAALDNGFERAELWIRGATDWELLGSGGGLPVTDDLVLRVLDHRQPPRLAHRLTLDKLGASRSRSLYAAGYQSVVSLSIAARGVERLRLIGYDASPGGSQQQMDALELIGGHVATAWKKSERIQELDEWSQRLAHDASHDQLTGLPNRAGLFEELEKRAAQPGAMVLFFDLNGFKAVNDAHGHEAGDTLLQAIAHRMDAALRPNGHFVARLGGDEFVVCASTETTTPEAICRTLISAIEQPVPFAGDVLSAGTSIGVAIATGETTGQALLRRADAAMYLAKERKHTGSAWSVADGPATRRAAAPAVLHVARAGARFDA